MTTACVLVDGPVEGDFRLLRSIDDLPSAAVINIAAVPGEQQLSRMKVAFGVARLVGRALVISIPRWRKIRAVVGASKAGPFAGLPACLRWLRLAVIGAQRFRPVAGDADLREVHAHDLYCGVAAICARLPASTRLVYDSHEFQIHRNRATGLLRILIEAGLEQAVLRRTSELRVVNNAIAGLMGGVYEMPSVVQVRLNDFYPHHPARLAGSAEVPGLIYVGKGVTGRCLEALDSPAESLGFEVFAYLFDTPLPTHISGRHWHHGPAAYEDSLLQVVRARRCMMWCCVSTSAVSYRLATPNKLFQALAMGIPVIASAGTYLADLIHEHGIGVVLDDRRPLKAIARQVLSPLYEEWVRNVDTFRARVHSGDLVI